MRDGCPFCDYEGPSKVLLEGTYVVNGGPRGYFVIEPMEPVTPGHLLVVPRDHEPDFRRFPRLLGALMTVAATVAGFEGGEADGCNVIASAGDHSTLTVPHMHIHVVPRRDGDGLTIPWGKLAHEHEPKPQPGTPEFDSWVKREESVR